MAIHRQIIHEIFIRKLKNISQVRINLEGSPLISLMGVNGCGKSTILYALCCVYKPIRKEDENYKFSRFFPPHNHFDWSGSDLSIDYSYYDNNNLHHLNKNYQKNDRWVIYDRRPERYVKFIEIKTCVPVIESENKGEKIQYTTTTQSDKLDILIRQKASYILNKNYDSIHVHTYKNKTILGVKIGETQYSALTMGAGEQRVFTILDAVFRTPFKSSLILIDEIDVLLHPQAIKNLITVIHERAIEKEHQIIFTSHNTGLFELKDKVELRHIHQTGIDTVCIPNTTPDITRRMTGKQIKSIEIYVEDDLAQAIVSQICRLIGIFKDVVIHKYGAAINAFTVSGGLALSRQSIDNALFVLDGDIYVTEEEKKQQIERVITGHGSEIDNLRHRLLKHLTQFNLPKGVNPENFIFNCIRSMPNQMDSENEEIRILASDIVNAGDHHNLVKLLIEQMGCSEEIGLNTIIRFFSQSPEWSNFSESVQMWLKNKKLELYG